MNCFFVISIESFESSKLKNSWHNFMFNWPNKYVLRGFTLHENPWPQRGTVIQTRTDLSLAHLKSHCRSIQFLKHFVCLTLEPESSHRKHTSCGQKDIVVCQLRCPTRDISYDRGMTLMRTDLPLVSNDTGGVKASGKRRGAPGYSTRPNHCVWRKEKDNNLQIGK